MKSDNHNTQYIDNYYKVELSHQPCSHCLSHHHKTSLCPLKKQPKQPTVNENSKSEGMSGRRKQHTYGGSGHQQQQHHQQQQQQQQSQQQSQSQTSGYNNNNRNNRYGMKEYNK